MQTQKKKLTQRITNHICKLFDIIALSLNAKRLFPKRNLTNFAFEVL